MNETQADYIEFGTVAGQNVTLTGHIDRSAIPGLLATGRPADDAVTIDDTTSVGRNGSRK